METRISGPEILVGPEFQGMRSLSRMPKEKLSLKYSSHYPSPKTNCNFCPQTTTPNQYSVHPVFHVSRLVLHDAMECGTGGHLEDEDKVGRA